MLFIYKLNNVHLFFSSHCMPAGNTKQKSCFLQAYRATPLLKSRLCLQLLDCIASLDMSSSSVNRSLLYFPKKKVQFRINIHLRPLGLAVSSCSSICID